MARDIGPSKAARVVQAVTSSPTTRRGSDPHGITLAGSRPASDGTHLELDGARERKARLRAGGVDTSGPRPVLPL